MGEFFTALLLVVFLVCLGIELVPPFLDLLDAVTGGSGGGSITHGEAY